MKCGDPVLCYTAVNGARQFRHFSLANDIYREMAQQVFSCGQCIYCRKRRAYELASRCVLHASLYKENCFVTLTYDEKKEGYHNNFEYRDIQLFKKDLRTYVKRHFDKRIEVFNVHEYGKNGKKHWHLIVFNFDFSLSGQKDYRSTTFRGDKTLHSYSGGLPLYTSKKLSELWPRGYHTIGDVSEASAMYQAQYCEKDFKNRTETSIKKAHSRHSGLGKPYFLLHYKQILELGYIPMAGKKLPVPRYFQKIAHKHYCHFYDRSAFVSTSSRKALYRPFTKESPSLEMADLFLPFHQRREDYTLDLIEEWDQVISHYLTTKEDPDFMKSASNNLYDLRNKQKSEVF